MNLLTYKLSELPNAVDGLVVTRFPPEASGYLHLGHIKALLINYLYAKKYNGKIILRFDDTNPEKENSLYEQAILEDIKLLGLECDEVTYTSDYFPIIEQMAIALIRESLAYVDFSTGGEINNSRAKLLPSPYRNSAVGENLAHFDSMRLGNLTNCCLRAKIDYTSRNGCMRDPVIYRAKAVEHPRHGSAYCIYPTYDFACPILDAQQGVTHAMRSVEYSDRDCQYDWFLFHLNLYHGGRYPLVSEYGKLNFTNTVLSKRKLAVLVGEKLVDGWNDPRMPTLRGIIRRGICIQPLLEYIALQLNSKAIVQLTWDKLWHTNRMHLDRTVNRIYGVDSDCIKIKLVGDIPLNVKLSNHPKDPSFGTRTMPIGDNLLVDASDFSNAAIGTRYTLVGLGNAVVISVEPLVLQYDALDKNFRTTIKVTWLPDNSTIVAATILTFGHLLSKPKMDVGDNILDCFNTESLSTRTFLLEDSIKNFSCGSVIQIMRKGYFYVSKIDSEIILHEIP